MTTPPVLILAIGNESRGDDAIAPLLLRELDAWLKQNQLSGQFELLEDFQLQVEHAADLVGRELVLFLDAGMDTPAPYSFYRASMHGEPATFSHAIPPDAVLATYIQVYRQPPPPAFVLCIPGKSFELGEALSPEARERMTAAMKFLQKLARNAQPSYWEKSITSP